MIEDKNIYALTNEQFAYIFSLIDSKYEADAFSPYSFKEIILN